MKGGPTGHAGPKDDCLSSLVRLAKNARPRFWRETFTFLTGSARDYVESTGRPWFILSAEYGLVSPHQVLAPYERTLNTMSKAERNAWAKRVKAQMETRLPAADRIVVLAGQRYRESLMDYLRQRARTAEIPMEGLTIGRQLQYLTGGLHHDRL